MNLEQELQEIAELYSSGSAVEWELGDRFNKLIDTHGKHIIGTLAETVGRSKEYIRQKSRVAAAFPPQKRYPDVSWSLYRKVFQTANALDKDCIELLGQTLENDWTERNLAALTKSDDGEPARLKKHCEYCNSKVSIEADSGLAGIKVNCPVCAADSQTNVLGVLEW